LVLWVFACGEGSFVRRRTQLLLLKTTIALLSHGELLALALGKGDPCLRSGSLSNNEHVAETSGELEVKVSRAGMRVEKANLVTSGILDVHNVEVSGVLLAVNDVSNTASVASTGDEDLGAVVELDEVEHLAGGEVNLHGVEGADVGIGVSDRAAIVGGDDWDAFDCSA
jgi:hypothetical protein